MRVHRAVAQKFISGAVELISARARDDIDLAAAGAAHFRGVAARLHFEFLHGIGGGTEVQRVEGRIGVGCAVEKEIVGVGAVAADADGGALAGAPVEWIHVAGLRAVTNVRAGDGEDQIDEHSAVERQFLHRGRLDNFANAGVGGV